MNATTDEMFIKTCYIMKEEIQAVAKFPSTGSLILYVIALLVNVGLFFTTVFFNGVTVTTILNTPKLKGKVSNFVILMQSIFDLVSGVFITLLMTLRLVNDLTCSPSSVTVYVVKKVAFICYVYSITPTSAMSFERFMGVRYPFVHRVKVTKARLLKYIVSVSLVQTLLYSFSFINGSKITRPFLAGNSLLFIAFNVFAYTRIFRARVKNNKFPLQQAVNVSQRNDSKSKEMWIKELKIAKSCFLVAFTTFMLFFPSFAMLFWIKLENVFLDYTLRNFCYILTIFNFTANPLIYFWRNKALRTEGMKRVKKNLLNKILPKHSEVQRAENS